MDRTETKTKVCSITLHALNQRKYIDQLSWVMAVLEKYKIRYISAGGSFNSNADLPFQATLALDATHKQALQLIWFFSDITLDIKNQAKTHFDLIKGQTAQCNPNIQIDYRVDYKNKNLFFDKIKRSVQKVKKNLSNF